MSIDGGQLSIALRKKNSENIAKNTEDKVFSSAHSGFSLTAADSVRDKQDGLVKTST